MDTGKEHSTLEMILQSILGTDERVRSSSISKIDDTEHAYLRRADNDSPSTTLLSLTSRPASTATHPTFSDLAPGGQPKATYLPSNSSHASNSTNSTISSSVPSSSSTANSLNADPDATSTASTTTVKPTNQLLNYFFVFLALFILLIVGGLWFLNKCKKAKKAQTQSSGATALARDLEGWVNTRRWVHGGWRGGVGGNESGVRREEGFNELGEAPPSYQAAVEQRGEGGVEAGQVAVPLRTLSRGSVGSRGEDQGGVRPPSYPGNVEERPARTAI